MALTDTKIRKLRTGAKDQILRDSPGLFLHILVRTKKMEQTNVLTKPLQEYAP